MRGVMHQRNYGLIRPAAITGAYNVVFFDDFTTSNTIDTAYNTTGFKWYNSWPTWITINTAQLASAVSNGNSGGGVNASPAGGIVNIYGGTASNVSMQTCPNSLVYSATPNQPGSWLHGYFEAYIQYNGTLTGQTGWPAFWSWSTSTTVSSNPVTEVDFLEVDGTAGTYNQVQGGTIHNWADESADSQGPFIGPEMNEYVSSDWHTYGCLWKTTGTNTGSLTFYYDNTQVGSVVPTGAGTNIALDAVGTSTNQLYLILGTAGWPMNVDWARVWQ